MTGTAERPGDAWPQPFPEPEAACAGSLRQPLPQLQPERAATVRTAVLCGVNSRYSQTNPAIRSLAAYAAARCPALPLRLLVREYQTGQPVDVIARDLLACGADLYAFSCYIWNRRAVFDLVASLRRLQPPAWIAVGGPEVSFTAAAVLADLPEADFVISGEGEEPFARLLESLAPLEPSAGVVSSVQLEPVARLDLPDQPEPVARPAWQDQPQPIARPAWAAIPGLAWRDGSAVHVRAPAAQSLDLAALPFPYPEDELPALTDRLLYYESSRGCPFRCSYCLSSTETRLRFRPLAQTLAHLDRFMAADVRLVKFVDRTFNSDPVRARAIWAHLIRRAAEGGCHTRFHFELAGDRLEAADLDLLADAPAGLFQFEIGVQSVHPETLARIRRSCDLPRLFANVQALKASGRQHLHLDLIAGLPGESLADVTATFNTLYRLAPDQLQLGFLKLLPGTPILADADACGYRAQPFPPYEVLASHTLSAVELSHLHDIEAVLESFANSGHFRLALAWLVPRFASPCAFFEALAESVSQAGLKHQALSLDQRGSILCRLAGEYLTAGEAALAAGLLRADHYAGGRKDAPEHLGALEAIASPAQKDAIAVLRRSRLPGARIRVEAYPFSLSDLLVSGRVGGEPEWAVYDLSGPAPVLSEVLPAASGDMPSI